MSIQAEFEPNVRPWPDVHSSNDSYALRFQGGIGTFFLDIQTREIVNVILGSRAKSVLDVGGGHCQIAKPITDLRLDVTVTGSTDECEQRLRRQLSHDRYTFVKTPLLPLSFETKSFDVCTSIRMMSHLDDWPKLIAELCRVARSAVVIDFSSQTWSRGFSRFLLAAKRSVEPDTRSFLTQSMVEIRREFASHGFHVKRAYRQFAIPMALHRLIGIPQFSRSAESLLRQFRVTKYVGSPVIVTAVPEERAGS